MVNGFLVLVGGGVFSTNTPVYIHIFIGKILLNQSFVYTFKIPVEVFQLPEMKPLLKLKRMKKWVEFFFLACLLFPPLLLINFFEVINKKLWPIQVSNIISLGRISKYTNWYRIYCMVIVLLVTYVSAIKKVVGSIPFLLLFDSNFLSLKIHKY